MRFSFRLIAREMALPRLSFMLFLFLRSMCLCFLSRFALAFTSCRIVLAERSAAARFFTLRSYFWARAWYFLAFSFFFLLDLSTAFFLEAFSFFFHAAYFFRFSFTTNLAAFSRF